MYKTRNKTIAAIAFSILISCSAFSQDFLKEPNYKGDPLFDFIFYWWHKPYKWGGETSKGIDCSAFTRKLFQQVHNLALPRTAREQYYFTQREDKQCLEYGDLVFFKHKSKWHVGMFLVDGWFIHSNPANGVSISHLSDEYYSKYYLGAGRVIKTHSYDTSGHCKKMENKAS